MKLIDTDSFSIHEIQDKNGFKHRIIFVKDVEDTTTVERPKGKWLKANKPQHYYCSVCGGMNHSARYGDWREVFEFKYPYCPLCGAEMEGVEE